MQPYVTPDSMKHLLQSFSRFATLLCLVAGLSHSSQAAPEIINFQKTGLLEWINVIPGHHYGIQSKGNLSEGWTNLTGAFTNIQATGPKMSVSVPVGASQAFYRVVDLGSCCQNTGGSSEHAAAFLGSVCGDTTAASALPTTFGCGDGWFRVTVSECNASFPPLTVRVTLQPPSGTDYDLLLYRDGALIGFSANPGDSADSLSVSQDDNFGSDDSFDLIIEVRHFNAFPCTNWSLQVQGNVP